MAIWKFDLLYLAIGAVAGAYLRYRIGSNDGYSNGGIPVVILFINVLGSLVLGLSMTTIQKLGLSANYTFLIGIGFCGSFTTMSSFAFEAEGFLEAGKLLIGFLDIILNVGLSIVAIFAGRTLILLLSSFF